jgi:DNA replication protein DnaC
LKELSTVIIHDQPEMNRDEYLASPQSWAPVVSGLKDSNKFLPLNFAEKNFENFEKNVNNKSIAEILQTRTLDETVSIWLSGSTGSGKTHLLLSLMNHLAWLQYHSGKNLFHVKYWSYTDLCSTLRADPNNFDLFQSIRSPKFLFIDDLGTSKTTDLIQEKIYSLFNYRLENQLPTFVTTNLAPQDVAKEFNERLLSRIMESSVFIQLKGADYRQRFFKENMKKYEGLK